MRRAAGAAILGALLVSSCAKPKPTAVQIDPALGILIPPDTNLLVGARMEALRKTSLFQKYVTQANIPQLHELAKYTGVDVRKDLWELLFVSDGTHSVLLGRGDFPSEMETKLERDGGQVIPHKAYHIVSSGGTGVVFFNASTAGVGELDSLRSLIDNRGKTSGPPAALAERMKEIPAEVQLWAVSLTAGRNLTVPVPGTGGSLGMPIDSATVYFDLRNGLQGLARATAGNPEDAKKLHDAFKGLIGFGRLSAPANQPDMLRALDGLQVSQDQNAVNVKIEESADLVDNLVRYALALPAVRRGK
jgi:hypothetical protein